MYQGESESTKNNHFLGSITLEIPPSTAEESNEIDVTFRFDIDGILCVSAKDKSGAKKDITLANATGGLSKVCGFPVEVFHFILVPGFTANIRQLKILLSCYKLSMIPAWHIFVDFLHGSNVGCLFKCNVHKAISTQRVFFVIFKSIHFSGGHSSHDP